MSTKGGILDVNNTKKGKAKGRFLEWGGTKGRGDGAATLIMVD